MKPIHPETAECREWAEMWRARRLRTGLEANLNRAGIPEEEFWSRYAGWVEALRNNGYPGTLLDRVISHTWPGCSVLDIGAGTGAFALPLARIAGHVTCIEPSASQAAHLRNLATRERIHNITIIQQRWEDLDPDEVDGHDLVLAAHSLQMSDLSDALRKMGQLANGHLILIHTAGHNLSGALQELFAIESAPDYTFPYEVLQALGYHPGIELMTREYEVDLDLQLDIFRYNPGLTAAQCDVLRYHACSQGMVVHREGRQWLRRSHTDALISVNSPGRKEWT